jgi:hypothetical protein
MNKLRYLKIFEIELSNMEGAPVYDLKHQLTIGSEIGNIIIADPSVSPRHVSFILQQEVVSVVDHASVSGTYVNGKKIPAGRYIILEEADEVRIGDLEIKLKSKTVSAPEEEIPEIPLEKEEVEHDSLELDLPPLPKEATEKVSAKKKFDPKEHLKKNSKKNEQAVPSSSKDSANALIRVIAVAADLLLAYIILAILMPFDEFRSLIHSIPAIISSFLGPHWNELWTQLSKNYGFVADMLTDGYKFFDNIFNFIPLLTMFVIIRVITALFFGASVSELILGIRASGNTVWKRIGGVLRVLLGVVTWPFIIFDIPAISSKRTFKEVITFTNLYISSKFITVLGIIFYVPLILALTLVAPLFRGLEVPETILVNDVIDQRVKVSAAEVTESSVEVKAELRQEHSRVLNLDITYDSNELLIIPSFRFQGVKNKLHLINSLVFYQKDLKRRVEFEVFKNFHMKQWLALGLKGNVFLSDKYPDIYNYVYSSAEMNPNFKATQDVRAQRAFANEFIQFTKMAFSLTTDNALDIMQEQTLLIKGLVDFKNAFKSLVEYKDFNQVSFIKIGNATFLRISFDKQKPFDLIMPLIKGEGVIFKVSWDKKEDLETVASKFYKFNLDKTNWFPDASTVKNEVMSSLEVYDLFSGEDFKTKLLAPDKAQGLYAYYFETSGNVLKRNDPFETELWKEKVFNIPRLLEAIPEDKQQTEFDMKDKLLQNFRDLIDALENNNLEYFGVSQKSTI